MKTAVCPKCKSDEIKIIKPEGKITYICEKCNFRQELGNTEMAKRLFDTYQIYISSLSHCFVYQKRQIEIEDVKKLVLEQFVEIMEEYK